MDLKHRHLTFFMNKLSCLEHLSTLSFSTEMSEMLLHGNKEMRTTNSLLNIAIKFADKRHKHTPYVGELGRVVVPVDEAEKDLQHQQPDLRVLI